MPAPACHNAAAVDVPSGAGVAGRYLPRPRGARRAAATPGWRRGPSGGVPAAGAGGGAEARGGWASCRQGQGPADGARHQNRPPG